jgi:cytochrome b561
VPRCYDALVAIHDAPAPVFVVLIAGHVLMALRQHGEGGGVTLWRMRARGHEPNARVDPIRR